MKTQEEYEIKMFHNGELVDESHVTTSDKEIIRISYEYAIHKGYTFSSKKV